MKRHYLYRIPFLIIKTTLKFMIWLTFSASVIISLFLLTTNHLLITQYVVNLMLHKEGISNVSYLVTQVSESQFSLKDIQFTSTEPSSIKEAHIYYSSDLLNTKTIDSLVVKGLTLHASIKDKQISLGQADNWIKRSNTSPEEPSSQCQIKYIAIRDSTILLHHSKGTSTIPFSLELYPSHDTYYEGVLDTPSIDLTLNSYPLGNIGNLSIDGSVKGHVKFLLTDSYPQILSSHFISLNQGSVRFIPSPHIQQSYANQQQMQLLLTALEDYRYQTGDLTLSTDTEGNINASLQLKGKNPKVSTSRDVNININLTGNVIDLFSQTPYDIPPVVKSLIEKIGAY